MYSLLHDASAVNLVNDLFSERTTSPLSSIASRTEASTRDSGPGKYRVNATRQAWGVVTNPLKRRETSETAARSFGERCEMACVKTSA